MCSRFSALRVARSCRYEVILHMRRRLHGIGIKRSAVIQHSDCISGCGDYECTRVATYYALEKPGKPFMLDPGVFIQPILLIDIVDSIVPRWNFNETKGATAGGDGFLMLHTVLAFRNSPGRNSVFYGRRRSYSRHRLLRIADILI